MNNAKGVTIVELMVVVVLLGLIIALAVPMYISYSQEGALTHQRRQGREILSMTLLMLRNDLQHAGFATFAEPRLGLLLNVNDDWSTPPDQWYDELIIGYGRHLQPLLPDHSDPDKQEFYSDRLIQTYLFQGKAGQANPWNLEFQDDTGATQTATIQRQEVGAALKLDATGNVAWEEAEVDPDASPPTFSLASGATLDTSAEYAPAVSWVFELRDPGDHADFVAFGQADPNPYVLMRNGQVVMGNDGTVALTNDGFQVRCQYINRLTGNLQWAPQDTLFANLTEDQIKNIMVVEVTLRYFFPRQTLSGVVARQTRIYERTLRVSPRALSMTNVAFYQR